MKFSLLAAAATSLLSLASAQDLSQFPTCSLSCFTAAVATTSCGATDAVCQCTTGKQAITDAVTPCIEKACSQADIAKVAPAAATFCQQALAASSSGGSGSKTGSATGSAATKSGGSSTTASAVQQTSNVAVPLRLDNIGALAGLLAAGALAL